jgi:hypothetical protein
MKPGQTNPRSSDAFQKWSDEHRAQVWDMIEKLGKGEITYKEARGVLREEEKALSAISKQVFGFKTGRGPQASPTLPASRAQKTSKLRNGGTQARPISSRAPSIG